MLKLDIAHLIRSDPPDKQALGAELLNIERTANDNVNLWIDTPKEKQAVYQSLKGDQLALFEDLMHSPTTDSKANSKPQVKTIYGPSFTRALLEGAAQGDAQKGCHKKKRALVDKGQFIVSARVVKVEDAFCAFTYEIDYRAKAEDDPQQVYGPISSQERQVRLLFRARRSVSALHRADSAS